MTSGHQRGGPGGGDGGWELSGDCRKDEGPQASIEESLGGVEVTPRSMEVTLEGLT